MFYSTKAPLAQTDLEELRERSALEAMLGFETLLETMPADAELPVAQVLGLARAVNNTVRDLILYSPRGAPNDN